MEQISQETLQKIKLPKNVRQIGTIDRNSRIYIEDYVVTYLKQMAEARRFAFGVAALFGRTVFNGKEKYVFISGAEFREEETEEETAQLLENGPSRELLYDFREQKERYFPELHSVGLALIYDDRTQIPAFWNHKSKLMSVLGRGAVQIRICQSDQTEEYAFCNDEGLEHKEGHYVYFDQNEAMQSFLVEWHASEQTGIRSEQEDYPAKTCRMVLSEKKENREQEKSSSAVSWASIFLLVAVCAIGIIMIKRYESAKDAEAIGDELAQIPVTEVVVSVDTIDISENQVTSLAEVSEPLSTNGTVSEENVPEPNITESNDTEQNGTEQAELVQSAQEAPIAEEVTTTNVVQLTQFEPNPIPQEYMIEKGDTLCSISRRYYGSESQVPAICEINHILDQDNIFYGQVIILP
ncbi:MAG TPA: LysM peptidoglycan-binding domain-containing protein [Lachnospiraceae bacterium]|nr:LysM peptidoglycan-binding domain-containing protein [Lachnospiraceae bacterium]